METLGTGVDMITIHENLLNFVKPDDHSKYSPSSADRWLGCPYSVKKSEGIVEEEKSYSIEGTIAHELCEAVYRQQMFGLSIPIDLTMKTLGYKDNGDEMLEAAQGFFEVCDYWTKNEAAIGKVLWFGQERAIPIFPERSCYGTGDFIIVGTKASVVIDFKYGRKPVKADSLQLKAYAAGIARHIDNVPQDYKFYAVVFQPRVTLDVKEICYTVQEMFDFLGVIWKAIEQAENGNNEPVEGNHCFWCPARRTRDMDKRCELIKEKPVKLANEAFDKFLADSNIVPTTTPEQQRRDQAIIKLMSLYPAIKQVVEQSKDDFKVRIENGEHIDGVVIKDVMGRRELNFESEEEAIKVLKKEFPDVEPVETVTKTKIKALGKLEKEIKKSTGESKALDRFCVKKIKKEVEVLEDRQKAILDSMTQFSQSISRS